MRRRDFIALAGGAAAWPIAARAQQAKLHKIGFLGFGNALTWANRVEALRGGLRQLGYVERENIAIEFRWTEIADQMQKLASELVESKVEVIFATSSAEVEAARRATTITPIVFATHADPVGLGHVKSLPRPGGNITGLSVLQSDLTGKALELLKEAVPHAKRLGVLWSPTAPSYRPTLESARAAGRKLSLTLHSVSVKTTQDFEAAFQSMADKPVDAFFVAASSIMRTQRSVLAALGLKHRLPSMFGTRENVEAGGLMSYAPDQLELTRRAATYIDKILRGAKPADLPVEQASTFVFMINLKTANALRLDIPATLLARADEVIE